MLRFNTFRALRYLRSRFTEGKYLLASEASDLQLENIDQARELVRKAIGDVAVGDAWKVSRLNSTQLLVSPGNAWFDGLPFFMKDGRDHLVSGSILTTGILPTGVTIADSDNGKVITFTTGTPSDNYKVVITAQEQIITSVQDEFLRNANLAEDTAQKLRLHYFINVVPISTQTESPVPYTNDVSSANLVNKIVIIGTPSGNGEVISINAIPGSEAIDGRDVEVILRNDPGLGGGNPIPNGTNDQQAFSNGILVDSTGQSFWINAIFNDVVSTQVVIRLDKEVNQANPIITNGQAFTLKKRDVYVADDVTGLPQGKKFLSLASANWSNVPGFGFVHDSVVVDSRTRIVGESDFERLTNIKFDIMSTGGGSINLDSTSKFLTWTAPIIIVNPFSPDQTISAGNQVIIDNGALIYKMNLSTGGTIDRGTLNATILSGTSTINFGALTDLSQVRVGNILKISTDVVTITSINDVSKQATVTPAISNTGSSIIYLDSFANGYGNLNEDTYVLAVRKGSVVWVANKLDLDPGETCDLGNSISQNTLTFIGATTKSQSNPIYTSTNFVTQGVSLSTAISELDAEVFTIFSALNAPAYDERILLPTGLLSGTNVTLPFNSRLLVPAQQTYSLTDGRLKIFVNQLLKFQSIDWTAVDTQTISFPYNLPNNSEIHFRMDAVVGLVGGGGGGTQSLQDTYNIGSTITTASFVPVTISGPSGQKLLHVAGDVQIDGVLDPTGIQLSPQASSPFAPGQAGMWVDNTANAMIFEDGANPSFNVVTRVTNVETGLSIDGLTKIFTNGTLSTIPAGTPVYTPSVGFIAPTNASVAISARCIGVTTQSIAPSATGLVAYAGIISGVTGLTHGEYLYLGATPGSITDVKPDLSNSPSGFSVVKLGVMDGTDLLLQVQHIGTL